MRSVDEIRAAADEARNHQQRAADAVRLSLDVEVLETLQFFEGVEDALRWAAGDRHTPFAANHLAAIERALQNARAAKDADPSELEDILAGLEEDRAARAEAWDDPVTFGRQHLDTVDARNAWLLEPAAPGWSNADVAAALRAGSEADAGR